MTDTAQPLGIVRSHDDLHALFRARAEQLEMSRENIDEVAGFQSGYASKLLAAKPAKGFGAMSFDALMGSLGLMLVAVVDEEAMTRFASKRETRTSRMVRTEGRHFVLTRTFMRKIGAMGGEARIRNMTPAAIRRAARKASRARWAKHKGKHQTPENTI